MSKFAKQLFNKKMEEKKNYGPLFLAGMAFGGLAGAVVALVMAPKSGPETRAMLMDKGIEIRDQVDQSVRHARSEAEGKVADVRGRIQQLQNSSYAATRAAQDAWREENSKALPVA